MSDPVNLAEMRQAYEDAKERLEDKGFLAAIDKLERHYLAQLKQTREMDKILDLVAELKALDRIKPALGAVIKDYQVHANPQRFTRRG